MILFKLNCVLWLLLANSRAFADPILFDVRVVDGAISADNRSISGRVEVFYNNTWGTICGRGSYWGLKEATVVCKQLGYSEAIRPSYNAEYGQGTGPIWLQRVDCSTSRPVENLYQCWIGGWGVHSCDHSEDAGVVCSAEPILVDVRVVDGAISADNRSISGRVEVFFNNTWGTICGRTGWSIWQAITVCKLLGYSEAIRPSYNGEYGQGTGPIWLERVVCSGSVENLGQCDHSGWGVHSASCDHSEDAGVVCSFEPILVDVRVVDGAKNAADNRSISGRVEVFFNNTWGTICGGSWETHDANVVCKQLGYSEAIRASGSAEYGQGTGPIWLAVVVCRGHEENLAQCWHQGWGIHYPWCTDHSKDAGVVCHGSACDPSCVNGDCTAGGVCMCSEGWSGPDCCLPTRPAAPTIMSKPDGTSGLLQWRPSSNCSNYVYQYIFTLTWVRIGDGSTDTVSTEENRYDFTGMPGGEYTVALMERVANFNLSKSQPVGVVFCWLDCPQNTPAAAAGLGGTVSLPTVLAAVEGLFLIISMVLAVILVGVLVRMRRMRRREEGQERKRRDLGEANVPPVPMTTNPSYAQVQYSTEKKIPLYGNL